MGLSITHWQLARLRPDVRRWWWHLWPQLRTITKLLDTATQAATSVCCNKPVSLAPHCNTMDLGNDAISSKLFTSMHSPH